MNKSNKNKGFSLIEIIVVIALMAIVTGATMSIYSWIKTQRIEKLTENISDCINDLRTACTSKDGEYMLYITKTNGEYIATIYKDGGTKYKETKLGSIGSIEVYDTAGNKYSISSSNHLHIRFDKSTGGIKILEIYDSGSKNVKGEIVIKYSDRTRKIVISEITGKHYIE